MVSGQVRILAGQPLGYLFDQRGPSHSALAVKNHTRVQKHAKNIQKITFRVFLVNKNGARAGGRPFGSSKLRGLAPSIHPGTRFYYFKGIISGDL
jgi:hypothetical protein